MEVYLVQEVCEINTDDIVGNGVAPREFFVSGARQAVYTDISTYAWGSEFIEEAPIVAFNPAVASADPVLSDMLWLRTDVTLARGGGADDTTQYRVDVRVSLNVVRLQRGKLTMDRRWRRYARSGARRWVHTTRKGT